MRRGRAVHGTIAGVGWPVVGWTISPVAAVSGTTDVIGWPRVIPVDGRAIASVPDTAPGDPVVVDATTPSPTPASPSPGVACGDQCSDANAYSEGDQRGCDYGAGGGRNVDDSGVVLGDVDDLWIGGLDDVDGLVGDLLDFDSLLFIAAECS